MNEKLFYLLSVGIAYFCGMKFTEKQIVIKEVIKEVKVSDGSKAIAIQLKKELKSCIEEHDSLVEEANKQIADLKADVDHCEEKYYNDEILPKNPNLNPEEVSEEEPTNEEY